MSDGRISIRRFENSQPPSYWKRLPRDLSNISPRGFKACDPVSKVMHYLSLPSRKMAVDRESPVLGSFELRSHAKPSSALKKRPIDLQKAAVCVCVIGVGYVGESLLRNFSGTVSTIGYDISEKRITALKSSHFDESKVEFTTEPSLLSRGTHFLVAVPTPLRDDRSVNLDYVVSAISLIVSRARPGSVIVIESSVPVGTTRKLLGPYKSTFNCGMSPERIDPGRVHPPAAAIPKIISALTPKALQAIDALYSLTFETLVQVSKPEVAEMTKLYENCYRMVNIAYVNEISDACLSHEIDPHEVIGAAATKPFGFQPFHPGLGVGGHCIPVNPWYLLQNNKRLPVLQLATELMLERPADLAQQFYGDCVRSVADRPRILVVGLGFKKNQANLSGSPTMAFAQTLFELGCTTLAFYDTLISSEQVRWMTKLHQQEWNVVDIEANFDAVAICNPSSNVVTNVLDDLKNVYVRRFV